MTGNDSVIRELFGIADCDLISTQESLENGKRCKTVHLKYCGNSRANADFRELRLA